MDLAARVSRLERQLIASQRRGRIYAGTTIVTVGLALACHSEQQGDKPILLGDVQIEKDVIKVGDVRITSAGFQLGGDRSSGVMLGEDGLSVSAGKASTRVRARGVDEQDDLAGVNIEGGVVSITGSGAHILLQAKLDPVGVSVFAGSAVAALSGAHGSTAEVSVTSYQGSDQTIGGLLAGTNEVAVTLGGHAGKSAELVVDDKPARVELKQK